MIKYIFKVNDNKELEVVVHKFREEPKVLTDLEAYRLYNRLSVDTMDNKYIRNTTLDRYKRSNEDLRVVDSKKSRIIIVENYIEVVKAALEARKKYSIKNKIVARIATVGVASAIGIGTMIQLFHTSGKQLTEDDLNKFVKAPYEKIEEQENNLEQQDDKFAVYVGDNKMTKELVTEALSKVENNTPINDNDLTTININNLEDEPLSSEEITNLVDQNRKDLTGEEIVDNYNKDRVFTGYSRVVDSDITKNIDQIKEMFAEISEITGISESLITDVFSQESSGGTGLNIGQIDFESHNEIKNVYNYKTQQNQRIVFSNDVEYWKDKADIIYTENDLKDKKKNALASMQILQFYLQQFKSIPLGLQAYNMGPGNIYKFIDAAIAKGEITEEDAKHLTNQQAYEVIENHAAKDGNTDRTYVANIFKHDDNTDRPGLNQYSAKIRVDGETVELNLQADNLIEEPEEASKTL